MLDLRAGTATASVLPELGGALATLRAGGRDILRPTPGGASDPLDCGCFPLVPYANRIADCTFEIDGRTHHLPPNFGDHPHCLHGLGWQRPWTVEEQAGDLVLLSHGHDGGPGWPWSYRATQRIALAPDRIVLALTMANLDTTPMPAGLGFHPYFPLDGATRLSFQADQVWLVDETMLPVDSAPAAALGDWSAARLLSGSTLIDNCYAGWTGAATIEHGDARVSLGADAAGWLHLYRPPDGDFFCIEPVTHMPDAINRGASMPILAPGESAALTMTIAWEGF